MPPPPGFEGPTPSGFAPGNLLSAADARTGTWKRQAAALAFSLLLVISLLPRVFQTPPSLLIEPLVVTTIFAGAARLINAITNSGLIAGWCISLVFYVQMGRLGFLLLFSVFVVTWTATRLGYLRKQRIGAAERREGRRASQLVANLGVAAAAACAIPFGTPAGVITWWPVIAEAALAEAAADTAASEIGQAFASRTYLITNLRRVDPGTNGGISLIGTVSALLAAVVVLLVPSLYELVFNGQWEFQPGFLLLFSWLIGAALAGMLVDSLLGATAERRGYLNNDAVNLLGTGCAAVIAWSFLYFFDFLSSMF